MKVSTDNVSTISSQSIKRSISPDPSYVKINPYETASIFSTIFFTWITPLILKGYQKPLEECDIPWIPRQFCSNKSLEIFLVCWKEEIKLCERTHTTGNNGPTTSPRSAPLDDSMKIPNARKAMYKSVWREYVGCICTFTPTLAIMIFQPYIVHDLLTILGRSGTTDQDDLLLGIHNGIALAVLLGVLSMLNAVTFCTSIYFLSKASFNMRSSVVAAVFQKSLRLSSRSKSQHTMGEMLTMITSDAERIWLASISTNWGYGGFILVSASVTLLIIEVGWSAVVAGVVILVLVIIFHFYITKQIGEGRRIQLKFAGERVKATNEILQVRVFALVKLL